jgi:N-acetylneuraminate synthase
MSKLDFWNDLIQVEPWPIVRDPLVIAEIGINHNGSIEIAKQLIDLAKSKGCQAVKFQKRTPELCVPDHQRDIPRDTPWGMMTYFEYKKRIEFEKTEFDEIDRYCREVGIQWFASAWDIESQRFLQGYNLPYNKIASAMLTHTELLEEVASEGRMTFVSVGMSEYGEIDAAVEIFKRTRCPYIVMHSVSEYPAGNEVLNLRQIDVLRRRYNVPVGYSGHEMTMLPGVLAVMMGAVAIERHITLNRAMWGTDHASSLEPKGLETLMNYIGQIPVILGTGDRVVTENERKNANKMRFFRSSTGKKP